MGSDKNNDDDTIETLVAGWDEKLKIIERTRAPNYPCMFKWDDILSFLANKTDTHLYYNDNNKSPVGF